MEKALSAVEGGEVQTLEIDYLHAPALEMNKGMAAQQRERAVQVDMRQAERVCEVLLPNG
jgi:hypothetical protein